jgi:hypothetical protein
VTVDWDDSTARGGLFLWEAFVTARAKKTTHIDDATVAVTAFADALPDPTGANAVEAERPLSPLGGTLLWSGFSDDVALLNARCLVIKAIADGAPADAAGTDVPARSPRAHRDQRENARRRDMLDAPHVAPLTQFVRRLRAIHGAESVPSSIRPRPAPTAPILLLFENPASAPMPSIAQASSAPTTTTARPRTCGACSARPGSSAPETSSPGTSSRGTSVTRTA